MDSKSNTTIEFLQAELRDKAWGMTVTTIGHRQLPASEKEKSEVSEEAHNPKRHTLNEYRLIYITQGEGFYESASQPRTHVEAGTMLLTFPNEWYTLAPDTTSAWEDYITGFNGMSIDNITRGNFFSVKNCIFRIGIDNNIVNIYLQIFTYAKDKLPGYQQICGSLVHFLLGRVYYENINHTYNDNYITRIINQAKTIISNEGKEQKSIEEIADKLGISYSRFRREFKRQCGTSPGQYRQEVKMIKAKELLHTTDTSIADIADSLNFESLGQFSTFFRKRVGVPPLEYRKRQLYSHKKRMGGGAKCLNNNILH